VIQTTEDVVLAKEGIRIMMECVSRRVIQGVEEKEVLE